MRTTIFRRPENDIHITRLATGKAIVRLYTAYIENPLGHGTFSTTANVVETTVPDRPDLEAHVLRHWKHYYDKAVQEEIAYVSGQYEKTINDTLAKLPPGKKKEVADFADDYIRQIAHGDKPFIIQQEFAKILKYYI